MLFQIKGLSVNYGKAQILDSVELNVDSSEVVAVIGANGAGKTTILNAVSGLITPTSGEILYKGQNLIGLLPSEIIKRGITHCPEGRKVFPGMTVSENLHLGAYLSKGNISVELDYVFSLFPILKKREKQRAGTLSGGEQGMLAIGRALMGKPSLLLVDEPTLGLAPLICAELAKKLKEIAQFTSILLIEQNARLAFATTHRCYVLENGKVIRHGKSVDIQNDPQVRQDYLGI